ncbi:hypothetical protein RB195_003218 [Necator americanus]|uniref:EB domain-containing protein n=1 Tax=Necator americanus TaxID=51031 RepID=A0ABR1DMJ5_NECAM
MLLQCFLIVCIFKLSDARGTPMYAYIRELCPPGLQPLTGARHVRTCDDKLTKCPRGSSCIQGVCCLRQPSCNHFTYKYSSQYSCLPRVKQNCPEEHKCVPSSQEGMHICCSLKPPRIARIPPERAICPASHPVISNDRQHLRLCSQCQNGICTPFRSSDVSICCHSSSAFCGPGSNIEMDGLLARDCSKLPCSEGYECSLAPSGSRVCCSLAECSSGQRARAVCAAGCRRDEECEVINGQRWCCPATPKRCPGNALSNGAQCSSESPTCDEGFECRESMDRNGFLCCQIPEVKKSVAGYICQAGNDGLYCCPLDVEIDMFEETTAVPYQPTLLKLLPEKPCKNCGSKEMQTATTEQPIPKCPFAFREARFETRDEIKTCIGLLDFT